MTAPSASVRPAMAAADWTRTAEDITPSRDVWSGYLDVHQLSQIIRLSPNTIMDVLNRNPQEDDPNSAIYRPAARIGKTALNALPMWRIEQANNYNKLVAERGPAKRIDIKALPLISARQAIQRGLATFGELAKVTGRHESALHRWRRECPDFPEPVAKTRNAQYGPPVILYRVTAVRKFCAGRR